MNSAPGKGLLKVTGILFIVLGGFTLLTGILAFIGSSSPEVLRMASESTGVSEAIIRLSAISLIAVGMFELAVGILGVKNCNKPEKAQTCFIIAVILVLLILVSASISLVNNSFVWWSVLIDLILPILYILGALKNKEVSGTVGQGSVVEQAEALDKNTVDNVTDIVDGNDNK